MEIFDLTKLGKLIGDVFLGCLFVYIGDQDNPTLDSCACAKRVSEWRDGKALSEAHG